MKEPKNMNDLEKILELDGGEEERFRSRGGPVRRVFVSFFFGYVEWRGDGWIDLFVGG
jgi:hypothetical protein